MSMHTLSAVWYYELFRSYISHVFIAIVLFVNKQANKFKIDIEKFVNILWIKNYD